MARFVDTRELVRDVLPGFAIGTIRNWVSEGKIPHVKKGRRVLFDVDEIVAWMREDARDVTVSKFMEVPPWER